MFSPNETQKKLQLPRRRGSLATPVERLMGYYSKAPEMRLRARKAKTAGKRTKLGLMRFLFDVFRQNELLPRKDKLTNEKIAAMLLEEFPGLESLHRGLEKGGKAGVNDWRRRYNSGTLIKDVFPDRCSFRYNAEGFPVESRVGRRVLSTQEQREISERYRVNFKRPRRPLPDVAVPE